MSKSLYSLILNDEVIARIDNAAISIGTNRSNLINQILADYVSFITPEKRIKHIIEHIESMLSSPVLIPEADKSEKTFAVKTLLECKYRPTVKYAVELYRVSDGAIGRLKVLYRTHSEDILYNFKSFFMALIEIESKFLTHKATYEIADGKFIRTFVIPDGANYTQEEIARGISDYVKNFDILLKNYVYGKYATLKELEHEYKIYIAKSILI